MEGGFYQQRRFSPTSIATVAMIHALALGALFTAKMVTPQKPDITITKVRPIPLPPDPPPIPEPKSNEVQQYRSAIKRVDPIVELPPLPRPTMEITKLDLPAMPSPPGRIDALPPPPPPIPIREPARTEPRIDNGSELQPPYPASAQREGAEGLVQVRVAIGADGRVKAVQKVRASRDDFFAATERQALRHWRFKPATLDGRPIESSKVMTVYFRIDDLG
jgi:protein TonB